MRFSEGICNGFLKDICFLNQFWFGQSRWAVTGRDLNFRNQPTFRGASKYTVRRYSAQPCDSDY